MPAPAMWRKEPRGGVSRTGEKRSGKAMGVLLELLDRRNNGRIRHPHALAHRRGVAFAAELCISRCESAVRRGPLGELVHGRPQSRHGRVEPGVAQVDDACPGQAAPSEAVARIEGHRLGEVGVRLVELAHHQPRHAAGEPSPGPEWIEREGAIDLGERDLDLLAEVDQHVSGRRHLWGSLSADSARLTADGYDALIAGSTGSTTRPAVVCYRRFHNDNGDTLPVTVFCFVPPSQT
jgi:hypothetical protein